MSTRPWHRILAALAVGAGQPLVAQMLSVPPNMPALSQHAAAFDAARGQTVVVGGEGNLTGATFLRGVAGWTIHEGAGGPGRRVLACATYDSARQRVVVFGGAVVGSSTLSSELFEWNGATWTLRSTSGPSPRLAAAMSYDSVRQRVVLFGGTNANNFDQPDTWEWDGSAWTLRSTSGPGPHSYHAMAFDPVRNRTVLFGGQWYQNGGFDQTWEWDGTAWVQILPATRPSARYGHAMQFVPGQNRIVMFGGGSFSAITDETWSWDGTNWTRLLISGPPVLTNHAMAWDGNQGRLLLLGGGYSYYGVSSDVWSFDGVAWQRLEGAPPQDHARIAYDAARDRLLSYGGASATTGAAFGETWLWDGTVWARQQLAVSPIPRVRPSLCYDPVRQRTLLVGGYDQGNLFGDHWEWDGSSWLPTPHAVPARNGHALAYDSRRNRVVLFGGWAGGPTYRNDTWEFDGVQWASRQTATQPSARTEAGLGWDPLSGSMLLFGGGLLGSAANDTWSYDGTNWTQLAPASVPASRQGASITTDFDRRRCVLSGGNFQVIPFELWDWNGSDWVIRTSLANVPAAGQAAFHSGRGRLCHKTSGGMVEIAFPVDVAAMGAGGLNVSGTPAVGAQITFGIAPAPLAFLGLALGTPTLAPVTFTGGAFCGINHTWFPASPLVALAFAGPTLPIQFPLTQAIAYLPITAQAFALDPTNCFRGTNTLVLRIQPH